MTVTTRCARAGADGFLYLTDGAAQMADFQKEAVQNAELRQRLRSFGGQPVQDFLDLVAGWEKIVV